MTKKINHDDLKAKHGNWVFFQNPNKLCPKSPGSTNKSL